MFFNLKNFVKKGLLLAVGHKADYDIILAASNWYDKGLLIESDLAEIEEAINKQYTKEEVVNV